MKLEYGSLNDRNGSRMSKIQTWKTAFSFSKSSAVDNARSTTFMLSSTESIQAVISSTLRGQITLIMRITCNEN